jgi:hypothetical protein
MVTDSPSSNNNSSLSMDSSRRNNTPLNRLVAVLLSSSSISSSLPPKLQVLCPTDIRISTTPSPARTSTLSPSYFYSSFLCVSQQAYSGYPAQAQQAPIAKPVAASVWSEHKTDDGNTYWYNASTGVSQVCDEAFWRSIRHFSFV